MNTQKIIRVAFLVGAGALLTSLSGCGSAPKKQVAEETTSSAMQQQQQAAVQTNTATNASLIDADALMRKKAEQQRQQQLASQKRQQYHAKWQQQQAAQKRRQQHHAEWQKKQQQAKKQVQQPRRTGYGGQGVGNYYAATLTGAFAGNRQLIAFIERMVQTHGFNRNYLYGLFSKVRNRDDVARIWARTGGGGGGRGWYNYRSKFVTAGNIQKGTKFWNQYRPHLQRASQRYGVDPAYIVGIMGVETRWGRILGKHRVIDALTTSAIVHKRRTKFFFKELENYMLMTRSERMDPIKPMGSYAGAMGYGQFMPSSFRAYAVDFDGDGIRDLWNPVDAIGSVANYFAKHGWRDGQPVAVTARTTSSAYTRMPDGYKVKYSPKTLERKGIRPANGRWANTGRTHLLAFTTVPGGRKEPWIGYHNFYVITRYNHSNYYAMAVHQLGQAVKARRSGGGKYAGR